MLPTKFRYIWPSGFRGEEFLKSANQKQESPAQPCLLMDRDGMSNLYRGPSKFRFIWPNGDRREEFFKSANQKQVLPMTAMFVNGSGRNEQ
jgi:hypothetical protein